MNKKLEQVQKEALALCAPVFHEMEEISLYNTEKVLSAFRKHHLSAYHFAPSNGYGYGDPGREKLEEIWCDIFHAESALVRPHFVSGTHALATVLLALLEPGDTMVSAVGAPYDTMESVIGITGNAPGNLISKGVHYKEVPLKGNTYDLQAISDAVDENTKLVEIQRSRGYMLRDSLFPSDMKKIIDTVKAKNPDTICFVDNCYGEFTNKEEPIELGADITAGSLIKNAGGGLAPTGAYICGRKDLVERCSYVWTAPGLGGEMGSYAASYRPFFEGLFLAPHMTRQAMMSAEFCAAVFKLIGFKTSPENRPHYHGDTGFRRKHVPLRRSHSELVSRRFGRHSGTGAHAGICRSHSHGSWYFRAGVYHRNVCRWPCPSALCHVLPGRSDF